ncbi:MAG: hypothetical protein ABI451_05910 [Dokdonella sp.]
MTADEAIEYVRHHGVVLVSARGVVPRLTEAIVGAPIKGGWWGHPQGRRIFAILQAASDCKDILTCRLIDGKLTLVHRRLWPALTRVAIRFPADRISQVRDVHTATGRHKSVEVPFPDWLPAKVIEESSELSEAQALAELGSWVERP